MLITLKPRWPNKMNILSTGSIYLDINTRLNGVQSGMSPEREYVSKSYETTLGGSAVIAPLALAKLGLIPHFVGIVGQDDFGKLVSQKLEKSGIKSHLEVNQNAQTNVGINRIDENGQTYMDVLGNANSMLTPETLEAVVDREFSGLELLYLGSIFKTPNLLNTLIKIAKRFNEAGKLVFLDHGRVPTSLSYKDVQSTFGKLIPLVTHYAPSEQDIQSAWNLTDTDQLSSLLLKEYPSLTTHIKLGERGSALVTQGKSTQIPIHGLIDLQTNPNFVGAGDNSNAGFIYGISKGLDPIKSAKIANHVAYLHITRQKINELAFQGQTLVLRRDRQ